MGGTVRHAVPLRRTGAAFLGRLLGTAILGWTDTGMWADRGPSLVASLMFRGLPSSRQRAASYAEYAAPNFGAMASARTTCMEAVAACL